MEQSTEKLITWTRIFIFAQLILLGITFFWSFRFETGVLVRTVLTLLTLGGLVAAIFSRPYLLLLVLVLLGTSVSFNFFQNLGVSEWSQLGVFLLTLVFLIDVVIFGYLIGKLDLKSIVGKVYVLATVVCLAELFWLFSYLAANPLIRGAILVLVFHLFVGLLPHSLKSRLLTITLRQYLVVATILFVILLQFL